MSYGKTINWIKGAIRPPYGVPLVVNRIGETIPVTLGNFQRHLPMAADENGREGQRFILSPDYGITGRIESRN
jgi:hypothetical protein